MYIAMTHEKLNRMLTQLENEMEDAMLRHDWDGYFEAKGNIHDLEMEYCHMLD